jgi:hypothetical protein
VSGLRGRTRRGRLQQLDRWLCATEPALVGRQGRVLDVGLGDEPWTTVELAEAVDAEVIGLDAVASRVATARRLAPEHRFEVGEWTGGQREATVVRAMNVVRQLTPAEVPAAHARLGQALRPGGIVLEGSCSHTGDCLVAHVLRRREALVAEAMVFATTFARGFAPRMYLHQLPRDLRKRARGTLVEAMLLDWQAVFVATEGPVASRLSASVGQLADRWRVAESVPGVVTWHRP